MMRSMCVLGAAAVMAVAGLTGCKSTDEIPEGRVEYRDWEGSSAARVDAPRREALAAAKLVMMDLGIDERFTREEETSTKLVGADSAGYEIRVVLSKGQASQTNIAVRSGVLGDPAVSNAILRRMLEKIESGEAANRAEELLGPEPVAAEPQAPAEDATEKAQEEAGPLKPEPVEEPAEPAQDAAGEDAASSE